MVGRKPRYEIDIMIIQALEEEFQSRFTNLRKNQFSLPTFRIEKAF